MLREILAGVGIDGALVLLESFFFSYLLRFLFSGMDVL